MSWHDLVGFVGSAIVISAYFVNQQGWLATEDPRFPLANLVAAILILYSLSGAWNLSAAIVEAFWAAISIWGLYRGWRTRRNM